MSDAGRKNLSDKVSESVKPDSQKSYLEKGKEYVTDTADSAARKATPDSGKSFGQQVQDAIKTGSEDASKDTKNNSESLVDTASSYVGAAKEQVANAAQYVSSVVTGAKEGGELAAKK